MKIMKCAKLGWTERQHSCTDNCPDNKPTQTIHRLQNTFANCPVIYRFQQLKRQYACGQYKHLSCRRPERSHDVSRHWIFRCHYGSLTVIRSDTHWEGTFKSLLVFDCNYDWVNTIRYDSVYLTCSKKLTGSQLSLQHGINKKVKCETKNKTRT